MTGRTAIRKIYLHSKSRLLFTIFLSGSSMGAVRAIRTIFSPGQSARGTAWPWGSGGAGGGRGGGRGGNRVAPINIIAII